MSPNEPRALPGWLNDLITASERIASIPQRPHLARDLQILVGLGTHALGHHLRLAGWRSEKVWTRDTEGARVQQCFWSPPGQSVPRPPRGRPSIYTTWEEIQAAFLTTGNQ